MAKPTTKKTTYVLVHNTFGASVVEIDGALLCLSVLSSEASPHCCSENGPILGTVLCSPN